MSHTPKLLVLTLLLAIASLVVGCAESNPPPGAPKDTSAPTVEMGEEKKADVQRENEDVPTVLTADTGGSWATLSGRIVYDGKPPAAKNIEPTKDAEVCAKHKIPDERLIVSADGGIANAVVMLRTKGVEVAPSYASAANEKVTLDNKGCKFEPHVAIITTGQELALKNSDPIGHNSKLEAFNNQGINPILPAGGDPTMYKFVADETYPVPVSCNIHPWMKAWLVVRKDPYAAVTDADGKFAIKDLPAGKELEFALWQEDPGNLKNATFKGGKTDSRGRFKLKLKPGDNNLGDIKVSGAMFKK
jgi:plastocyanin